MFHVIMVYAEMMVIVIVVLTIRVRPRIHYVIQSV
jgi:hypothetical protein